MPGAEGRTGWPWNSLPWQMNWGFLIIEITPFLMLIGVIFFGVLSNRLRLFRRRRGAIVENMAGTVQDANGPLPYILIGVYLVVAIVVLIYTFNNAFYGENY
jgi:hypothetical protein